MRRGAAIVLLLAVGCTAPAGTIGTLSPGSELVSTKLLRPGARARACRTALLGVVLGRDEPPLDAAVRALMALDEEGDVLTNVTVRSSAVVTGLYDHRCVEIEADLGRVIPTVTIMAPHAHEEHGSH
jgi:hypothetical protein